ncbi:MAG: HEAT repeat domain-containing protein, partial [Bdellovibrionaceae bacterium]|nr:HEAT repeat domain-containing protein [Pseudobdellovibrionaceae bacterium]
MAKTHRIISDYYQLDDKNRAEAIDLLIEEKTSDASRELISIYQNCEWRETKLQILKGLQNFHNQRALQFLFKIALDKKDLPLSEAAVESLSNTHSALAQRFLFQLYLHGPDYIKNAAIKAVAKNPTPQSGEVFLENLDKTLHENYLSTSKNLILSLGEARDHKAIPKLVELLSGHHPAEIKLAAVVSLGKLMRQTDEISKHEDVFKKDAIAHQLFTNSINQIQFRNQWKLEDYLEKYFLNEHFHPAILNEISSFDFDLIQAGLANYTEPKYLTKKLTLLFQTSLQSFDLQEMTGDEQKNHVYGLIAQYGHSGQQDYLVKNTEPANKAWLNAVAFSQPLAHQMFQTVFASDKFAHLELAQKIEVINSFSDSLYLTSFDQKKMLSIAKWTEKDFLKLTDAKLISRWVRLFADHQIESKSLAHWMTEHLKNPAYTDSVLYYIENCPSHLFHASLIEVVGEFADKLKLSWLKAATAQEIDVTEYPKWKPALEKLQKMKNTEVDAELLKFLGRHPVDGYESCVQAGLASKDVNCLLNAVIASKKYKSEVFSELLAPLLSSANLSVQGRAFDALLSFADLRAQRKSIDFFKDHYQNTEVFNKFVRSFILPKTESNYFYDILAAVHEKSVHSEQKESLGELMSRYETERKSNVAKHKPQAADLLKIDKFLETNIKEYAFLDENIKQTLRSAEIPFHHPEMYDEFIDKSAIILGYSKAIDLILEKTLGKKHLLPQL